MTAIIYNEESLLQQVAAGNEAAFTKLFYYWQPFLATHIKRITESKPLTEEIVQDVFLKIWQTRETLAEVRNFKSYLLTISKNHAINCLQKIARESLHSERHALENQLQSENIIDVKDTCYSLIDEAIDKLSVRQKEVYLLHRHQRLTYQQIADQLHIGKESVKTHLQLAVSAISKYIKLSLAVAMIIMLAQH
ncbi:MAG: sigma-70 family RNA polymerase sigma factor [Ginsengibacter sp.]